MREEGRKAWSAAEVSAAGVEAHVRDGLYHLGFDAAGTAGVFRLQTRDPLFWPEVADGTSAYLHKLAVLPARRGHRLAHHLLRHAVDLTRAGGLRFLRLDCMGGQPGLRAVYESFGFQHHDQKLVHAETFDRFVLAVHPGTPDR